MGKNWLELLTHEVLLKRGFLKNSIKKKQKTEVRHFHCCVLTFKRETNGKFIVFSPVLSLYITSTEAPLFVLPVDF